MANVQDRGPPSTIAVVLATAIIAGLTGYFIGTGRSLGLFGGSGTPLGPAVGVGHAKQGAGDDASDSGDSDEDDEDDAGELKSFPDSSEELKLTLVVRTDLGMTKGMRLWIPLLLRLSPLLSRHATRSMPNAQRDRPVALSTEFSPAN